jgi:hypothetical protein
MLEVKSEKMVKYFFPKSFLDDLGGVCSLLLSGFLGAKSTSIRDCVRLSVRPSPTMRDYVEN